MNSIYVGLITFVCTLGGSLLGLYLRETLPAHHLSSESKEAIKMGAGFIATLAALVLGLLISSSKDSFDTLNAALTNSGARLIMADRYLASYGPEAAPIRHELREALTRVVQKLWSGDAAQQSAFERVAGMERILIQVRGLTPNDETRRWLQSQALNMFNKVLKERWLAIQHSQVSLPFAFWVVLLLWLTALFAAIGLLASRNTTVLVVMFVCALSISGAVFLIHEMNEPLQGLIHVSPQPILKTLDLLGK